ncbi:hypothetical protein ACX80V_07815 [Arthrobacter sp. MDT3-24]
MAIALAEPPAPKFVYNPWKTKDVRGLYINLAGGTKVGYLDLATLDGVPEVAATADLLQRALAGLSPVTAARRFIQVAQFGDALGKSKQEPVYALPWTDLSANRPG